MVDHTRSLSAAGNAGVVEGLRLDQLREMLFAGLSRECPHGFEELGDRLQQELARIDQEVKDRLAAIDWQLQVQSPRSRHAAPARTAAWRRPRCRVEHLFVIQSGSGLLLDHLSAPGSLDIDADAVAGMLTAIEHFVRDSMATGSGVGLGDATVGEYRLLISHGPRARVAVFVRGNPSRRLADRLDKLNEALHARYGRQLSNPQVTADRGCYIPPQALVELNGRTRGKRRPERDGGLHWMTALGSAAVFGLAAWSSPAVFRVQGGVSGTLMGATEFIRSHQGASASMFWKRLAG